MLALGLRSGEPGIDPVLVAELASNADALRVVPRPLSEAGVARLIADRLGAEPDAAFTAACLEATGGNPLLLRQLLSSLAEEDVRPLAGEAGAVRRIGPRAISRTVLVRLHRLGDQAVALAQALAVLGITVQRVAAALAGLTPEEAAVAASALTRAEILRPQPPARFVHPLVRDAIYHEMPFAERIMRHARAAALLAEYEAPPEQIATHLLSAPRRGDPWVVDVLAAAAASARAKGAADTAVSLLTRAIEEPPPPERRPGLLLELGLAEVLTSGPAAAAHLRDAWESLEDPRCARTRRARSRGRSSSRRPPARRRPWPGRPPRRRRRSWSTRARRCAPRSSRPRATEWAASRAWRISTAELIEGDGPGAKMLAAMVSFGLAMTGTQRGAQRRAGGAGARRRRAHRRRPRPVPRPRADGADAGRPRGGGRGLGEAARARSPPRLAARRAERQPVERAARCCGAASCARRRSGWSPRTSGSPSGAARARG